MPGAPLADLPVSQQDADQFQDQQRQQDLQSWATQTAQKDDLHDWAAQTAAADQQAQQQARTQADAQKAAQQAATQTYDTVTSGRDDLTAWANQVAQRDAPTSLTEQRGASGAQPVDVGGTDWRAYAAQAAQKAGIDPGIFTRQIQQESGFDPDVISGKRASPAGAQGIAQFMPETARGMGIDPLNPQQALDAAATWMRQLTDRYGGDVRKALAAYNAGPGNVDKYGGVPPFEETQRYVKTIYDDAGGPSGDGTDGTASVGPPPTPGHDAAQLGAARAPSRVEALGQFEQGLPYDQASAICGPVAALAFAQANGRNPDLGEARRLASQVGWTAAGGMNGVANEQKLLTAMGVKSRLDTNPDFGQISADAASGNPVIVSTPVHYYFVNGYDPDTGKLYVGKTGTSRKGGGSWMTPQEIATLDGGINGALFVDNPQSPTPSVGADPMAAGPEGDRPASEFEQSTPDDQGVDPFARRLGPDLSGPITPADVGQTTRRMMTPGDVLAGAPAGALDVIDQGATAVENQIGRTAQERTADQAFATDYFQRKIRHEPTTPEEDARFFASPDYLALTGEPLANLGGEAAAAAGPGIVGAARRFFHGTGSAFDRPEAAKFDANGLYGPGYYLTDNPAIASNYAGTSAGRMPPMIFSDDGRWLAGDPSDLLARMAETRQQLATGNFGVGTPSVLRRMAEQRLADYEAAAARPGLWAPYGGPNTRAVDVPSGLNLLDVRQPVDAAGVRAIVDAAGARGVDVGHLQPGMSGDALWHQLSNAAEDVRGNPNRTANRILADVGYDGIAHTGGNIMPDLDSSGQPIRHEVNIIFPESLDKIRNAISGTPGGIVAPGLGRLGRPGAANLAGAAAGGAAGYASSPDTDTTQQRLERIGAGALLGATGVAAAKGQLRGPVGEMLGLTPGAPGARTLVPPDPFVIRPGQTEALTAGDIRTELSGLRNAQVVRGHQLADEVRSLAPDEQGALFWAHEAGNDPATLKAWASDPNPKLDPYRADIQAAQTLSPDAQKALALGERYYDEAGQAGLDAGSLRNVRDNYQARIYAPEPPATAVRAQTGPGVAQSTYHARQRVYDTVYDAITQGDKKLATTDYADVLGVHNEEMARVNANRAMTSAMTDAGLGKWVRPDNVPDGWSKVGNLERNVPIKDANGDPVLGQDGNQLVSHSVFAAPAGIAKGLAAVADPSVLNKVDQLRALQRFQGVVKTVDLSLSAFHHFTMGMQTIYQTLASPKALANIATTLPKLTETLTSGAFRDLEQDFVRSGGMTSKVADNLDVLRKLRASADPSLLQKIGALPGVKQAAQATDASTAFLFGRAQRYVKVMDYQNKVAGWVASHPAATDDAVTAAKRGFAKEVNAAYGGLNWEQMGVSRDGLTAMRLALLAPDWTVSNLALGKYALQGGTAGAAARAHLASALVAGTALTEGANYLLTGHSTLQNPPGHETEVQLGPHAYMSFYRGGIGDLLKLASMMADSGPIGGVARYGQGKLSPGLRTLTGLAANEDYAGRKIYHTGKGPIADTLSTGKYIASSLLPVPLGVSSVAGYLGSGQATVPGAVGVLSGIGRYSQAKEPDDAGGGGRVPTYTGPSKPINTGRIGASIAPKPINTGSKRR